MNDVWINNVGKGIVRVDEMFAVNVTEVYTNAASAALAARYFEDVGRFERESPR